MLVFVLLQNPSRQDFQTALVAVVNVRNVMMYIQNVYKKFNLKLINAPNRAAKW